MDRGASRAALAFLSENSGVTWARPEGVLDTSVDTPKPKMTFRYFRTHPRKQRELLRINSICKVAYDVIYIELLQPFDVRVFP